MELLFCEYENHNLEINKELEKNAGMLTTKFKESFWEIEDDIDTIFCFEKMKTYESFFGDKAKSGGKSMSPSVERAEILKNIYQQLGSDNSYNLKYKKDRKKLKIDSLCLASIANVIKNILRNIIKQNNFSSLLDEVIDDNNFSQILDSEIMGFSLFQLKNEFNRVTELSFELSGIGDDEFEINYIILLYYFFKVLFPNVNSISINLDFIQASRKYNELKNPNDFKSQKMKEICQNYYNLFLSNFLVTCIISLASDNYIKLKIKSSESYINENNYIINKEYPNKHYREKIAKERGYIMLKKFMKIKTINRLSFSINSLDRFLFREIVTLIAFHREIETLELNLFYNPMFFNKRKIYLNYLKGQEFSEIDPNIIDKYGIVYYPYINTLSEEIMSVVEEEKIVDLLYPEFKKNLNNLKMILNEYIISFKEFSLDISPYDDISKYENYNIEILLFILVILSSLEKSQFIESLKLKCSNLEYLYVSEILKKINKLTTPKLIDLSKCEKLKNISLNIEGISLFLDFDKLPFNSLEKLELSISNLKDMEKISAFFNNHKNDLKRLTQVNVSFLFVYETKFISKEFMKIFLNLPPSVKILNITNENFMSQDEVLDIIKKIQKKNYSLNCELKCECLDLEGMLQKNKEEDLKMFFNSKGIINLNKCEIINDINRGIKLTLSPDENIVKSIIFCLNKIINNSDENQKEKNKKIFQNIFKFFGTKQNFNIILN